jgi:biopolymer transport protein TolQ
MGFTAGTVMGGRLAASLDIIGLILEAGLIVQLVLLLLAAFSVISWTIIAFKWRELARAEQDSEAFLEIYHEDSFSESYEAARQLDRSPLAGVFLAACDQIQRSGQSGLSSLSESVARSVSKHLSWTAAGEARRLERGLSFLATTGSSAPFIGLFGTVVGIIDAFHGIGTAGSASLAVVAPGIAEALVATAVGLVAAIPATIFYNVHTAKVDGLEHSIDRFRAELEDDLNELAHKSGQAPVRATGSGG